ncbi:MAG: methyltransferase domain-containing protein [Burkholderiales bacterium]|nr:MAG: methyltransferase domain-containing protein [Burkholderiales bacterium]
MTLHEQRLEAVTQRLLASGATSVLDLGCGDGELMARLAMLEQFERIVGIDISADALAGARRVLDLGPDAGDGRVSLMHASFTVADRRLWGFDAAALVETIEHVDPDRLSLVERAVFGCYRPRTVVVTTPNEEYNVLHGMRPGALRHPDHRFEWSRTKFRRWALGVGKRNGYALAFDDVGEVDPALGASTQMAVFTCSQQ